MNRALEIGRPEQFGRLLRQIRGCAKSEESVIVRCQVCEQLDRKNEANIAVRYVRINVRFGLRFQPVKSLARERQL